MVVVRVIIDWPGWKVGVDVTAEVVVVDMIVCRACLKESLREKEEEKKKKGDS